MGTKAYRALARCLQLDGLEIIKARRWIIKLGTASYKMLESAR